MIHSIEFDGVFQSSNMTTDPKGEKTGWAALPAPLSLSVSIFSMYLFYRCAGIRMHCGTLCFGF